MEFVKKHNRKALAAAKEYAASKPWAGDFIERTEKLREFHVALNDAYGVVTDLVIDVDGDIPVAANGFVSYDNVVPTIVLRPGFAIMTFLRLYAEAMDSERDKLFDISYAEYDYSGYAARWANGLFKKAFPKSWDKLVARNASILTRDYA